MVDTPSRRLAGRYELRGLIGRGGMAEVRLGYDARLSRIVAIKMLRTDLARDSIFQERFRREAHAAASLNHPAIVAVYDTGEEAFMTPDGSTVSVPYIVMEYVEGHTVRDLLQEGEPIPIDEAVEIVTGVLSALEYSHHEGLVHRDIKPGNIMVTNTGKIKVMDFGIARVLEDSQATMTQTDAVVGTAQYLSPEQAQGENVDARSDLYSTGCVLYELLTGRPPFKGDSAVAVAYQHVSEQPRTPSSIASDIPASLDRVVMRALAKRKQERYASAADMLSDLRIAAQGGPVSEVPTSVFKSTRRDAPLTQTLAVPPPPPAPPTSPAKPPEKEAKNPEERSSMAWLAWVLVGVAAALVAGVIYIVFIHSSSDDLPAPTTAEETSEANIPVPQITGLDQNEARKRLHDVSLEMRLKPERVFSDTVPADSVVSVEPQEGTKVVANSTVHVTLSKGAEAKPLANMAGRAFDDANAELKEQGFNVIVKTLDHPQVEKDRVVGTEPEAGTEVKKGETITLVVASGFVKIPSNLIGQPLPEVTKALEELGLGVSSSPVETGSKAPGTVISVRPVGTAPIHSSVEVTYAKKPESIAPPRRPATPDRPRPPGETPEGEG